MVDFLLDYWPGFRLPGLFVAPHGAPERRCRVYFCAAGGTGAAFGHPPGAEESEALGVAGELCRGIGRGWRGLGLVLRMGEGMGMMSSLVVDTLSMFVMIPKDEHIFQGIETADTCSYPMLFSKHVSFHVGLTSPAW